MANRIFISFLGTGNYIRTRYELYGKKSKTVRFIQEALVSLLCKDWDKEDRICIFCTEGESGSKTRNWEDNGQSFINENSDIEAVGLKSRFYMLKNNPEIRLAPEIRCIPIPEGFDRDEIWEIFNRIYGEIRDNDHIYLDVTHALRSIPIFSTVLLDYTRSMKDTTVEGIYYGAFEKMGSANDVKKIPVAERCAPIIDLSEIVSLQDTINVANNFRDFGKFGALKNITTNKQSATKQERRADEAIRSLKKCLDDLDDNISVCRMENIRHGKFACEADNCFHTVIERGNISKAERELLEKIVRQIRQDFSPDTPDKNVESAIEWAKSHNMLQQAYTLAQEHLISLVCNKLNYLNPYGNEKNFRLFTSSVLGVGSNVTKDKFSRPLNEYPELAAELLENAAIQEIRKSFKAIADNRNIINHAKRTDKTIKTFVKDLTEKYNAARNTIENWTQPNLPKSGSAMLINLSNHPSCMWEKEQLEAAAEYGRILDIPFPDIDPAGDEQYIKDMADRVSAEIFMLANTHDVTVHIMGEQTFIYIMVDRLLSNSIRCIASTTCRIAEISDGIKTSGFKFVRFRRYEK